MAGKSPREAAQGRAKRRQARARVRKGTKTGAYGPKKSVGRDLLRLGKFFVGSPRKLTPQERATTKYPPTGHKVTTTKRKKY